MISLYGAALTGLWGMRGGEIKILCLGKVMPWCLCGHKVMGRWCYVATGFAATMLDDGPGGTKYSVTTLSFNSPLYVTDFWFWKCFLLSKMAKPHQKHTPSWLQFAEFLSPLLFLTSLHASILTFHPSQYMYTRIAMKWSAGIITLHPSQHLYFVYACGTLNEKARVIHVRQTEGRD